MFCLRARAGKRFTAVDFARVGLARSWTGVRTSSIVVRS
jgi:hypothetical protein